MSNFQEWCVKVLPFIQAAASGEVIHVSGDNGLNWHDLESTPSYDSALLFDFDDYDYRIKPRTIMIGDIEVPEPIREEPKLRDEYFIVEVLGDKQFAQQAWNGMDCEKMWVSSGLCHSTKEAAITHAKALIALTAKKDASHE